jgi:hypothetical protein
MTLFSAKTWAEKLINGDLFIGLPAECIAMAEVDSKDAFSV